VAWAGLGVFSRAMGYFCLSASLQFIMLLSCSSLCSTQQFVAFSSVWELFKLARGVGECLVACGGGSSCSATLPGGSGGAGVCLCSVPKLKPPPLFFFPLLFSSYCGSEGNLQNENRFRS